MIAAALEACFSFVWVRGKNRSTIRHNTGQPGVWNGIFCVHVHARITVASVEGQVPVRVDSPT